MAATPHITIRDLASRYGVTLRALRFYEGEGLLRPVRKGLRRFYPPLEVERLHLILRAKAHGLTIDAIRAALRDREDGHAILTIRQSDLAQARLRIESEVEAAGEALRKIDALIATREDPVQLVATA